MSATDVIVIGGGIIGLAVADRLAAEGQSVILLESGKTGREASWAGAGILNPLHPHEYPEPLVELCGKSQERWEGYAANLAERTGISVEYRECGSLSLFESEEEEQNIRKQADHRKAIGLPGEVIDANQLRDLAPKISDRFRGALYIPDVAQIRNPRVLKAMVESVKMSGGIILEDRPVTGLLLEDGRVQGVKTPTGDLQAGWVVLAAGSWSPQIVRDAGLDLSIKPYKGQIVLLRAMPIPITQVITWNERYLVPRADKLVLVGSTVEDAGFDKSVSPETVDMLLEGALAMCPDLTFAIQETAWAGLRPGTPDRLPYIGPVPKSLGLEGLVLAAGHFRNGLLLAPVTADVVCDVILGNKPSIDLKPFGLNRQDHPSP